MTSMFTNLLSDEDINYLLQLPNVTAAKAKMDTSSSGAIYFTVPLTESIRNTIHTHFGLDLSNISEIPMRWVKGDTAPHIDRSVNNFQKTHIIYVNNSAGNLLIDNVSYPITAGSAFVFNEGVSHSTVNTGEAARLLLGPMNEFAQPVGAATTFYYPSQADALAQTNLLQAYGGYTIVAVSGYTHWRIASNSTGPSPQNVVYTVGQNLIGNNTTDLYYLYPTAPCFLEGTTILCQVDGVEKYIPVETIKAGTLVKTSRDGYKKVELIGKGTIYNPGNNERIQDRLYKCSPSKYSELKEDLYITGCHSILEFPITEKQKEDTIKLLGKLYVTDKKYRLMACVDERAEPWNSEGQYVIWHFALEHTDDGMNYGVYANGGLLVETCSIRFLKNKSNMKLM